MNIYVQIVNRGRSTIKTVYKKCLYIFAFLFMVFHIMFVYKISNDQSMFSIHICKFFTHDKFVVIFGRMIRNVGIF